MDINYFPLLIIFICAWVVPMVLSWQEISIVPSVIMEIVLGVIIGPHILNLVSAGEPYLDFLAYTGFLFLIFLSGLALDIQKIISSFPHGKIKTVDIISNTFLVAFLIYIGSIIVAVPVVYLLSLFYDIDKFFLVILLPSVALSIIVPIIKNDGEITRKFGQIILLEGAIATIMTILLIAVYSGIQKNGFQFELLLFLIIFVLFFVAYKVGKALMKIRIFNTLLYQLEHAASQIRIRGTIAILLIFVVIASLINTEPVLGAFFAGSLLSIFLPKERSALLFKMDGMGYGFFIPIFFIMVGVNLDIASLKDFGNTSSFIVILVVAFYIVQIIPGLIMTKVFGIQKSLRAGILLTSRLGLSIATAQIGLSLGLISPATNTGIVMASIITCILSPVIYKSLTGTEDNFYSIYIIGGGVAGTALAKRLKLHGVPYLVIEPRGEYCKKLQSEGIEVIKADIEDVSTFKSLKIRPVDTLAILTESEKMNLRIAKQLKYELNHSKIITVTMKSALLGKDNDMSEVKTINVYDVIASQVENEILLPTTTQALKDSFGLYSVEEIQIKNNGSNRRLVKEIPFPKSGSLVVLRRENEIFIPHGDTHLLTGDLVTVIGDTKALNEFRRLLE